MSDKKRDELLHDHNNDGVNRQGFLKCMAWAGTRAFCVMHGDVLKSYSLSRLSELSTAEATGDLSFVQISDSHVQQGNLTRREFGKTKKGTDNV
jgi:hypothetical protein